MRWRIAAGVLQGCDKGVDQRSCPACGEDQWMTLRSEWFGRWMLVCPACACFVELPLVCINGGELHVVRPENLGRHYLGQLGGRCRCGAARAGVVGGLEVVVHYEKERVH